MKGSKAMRKTINIDDTNYERIKALADKQKMTITSVINMAVDRYIISHALNETFSDIMMRSFQQLSNGAKDNK